MKTWNHRVPVITGTWELFLIISNVFTFLGDDVCILKRRKRTFSWFVPDLAVMTAGYPVVPPSCPSVRCSVLVP